MTNKEREKEVSTYRIKREAENERTEELLVYLIENDLLSNFDGLTDIIDCFPTDVPNLIKKLRDSNGIDNDEVIEALEVHYDIEYCGTCGNVLDAYDGGCYDYECPDSEINKVDDDV